MKKIFWYLSLIPLVALMASCEREEMSFSHESQTFESRAGKILIEAVTRDMIASSDALYIAGPALGDAIDVVGNPAFQLEQSAEVPSKWGIYLDPKSFKNGKTLADGFWFFTVDNGREYTPTKEEAIHKLDAQTGERYLVYMAGRWRNLLFVEPTIQHDGPVIYVDDQTGWDALSLYLWGDVNELNGGWPGMAVTGTEKVNGKTWKYFDIGESNRGLNENLIFNNGGNGTQLPDFNLTLNKNYFLIVTADGVSEDTSMSAPSHKNFRVYADNQTGWAQMNLYMYSASDEDGNALGKNDLGRGWPGLEAAGTLEINGVTYVYYEIGPEANGLTEKLIFNDGGNGSQIPGEGEPTLKFEFADYFFTVTADGAVQLENPYPDQLPDLGEIVPEEPTFGPNIYVKDETTWPGNRFAHYWGDGYGTDWPGTAFSETVTIDGDEFYVIPTDGRVEGQTIGIIFHSDENDGENRIEGQVTLDKERFYVITNDAITEMEMGYVVYVDDQTEWPGNLFLHIWTDSYSTEWPGIAATDAKYDGKDVKAFRLPKAVSGQLVNAIFHSDEDADNNRVQGVIDASKDRYFTLKYTKNFEIEDNSKMPVKLYVKGETGWDDLFLYGWASGEAEVFGGWHGAAPSETLSFKGETYYVFDVSEEFYGKSYNLIFNNNADGLPEDAKAQFDAMELKLDQDYFLEIKYLGDRQGECNIIEAPGLRIYVEDNTGWGDNLRLYAWGSGLPELFGGWPGAAAGGTQEVKGKTWRYFDVAASNLGLVYNPIFNNKVEGVPEEEQTQYDAPQITLNQDIFFSITATEAVFAE